MTFTTTQIRFLHRLVAERPATRAAGETAMFFCEHASLGTLVGRFVEYTAAQLDAAAGLLRAHNLPEASTPDGADRGDVATFGGLSEKQLSVAPHADSVPVRLVGHCLLDGQAISTPAGSYLVTTAATALRAQVDRILLVENLETFRQLDRYEWIDYDDKAVMVLYRGDTQFPPAAVAEVIAASPAPLWAFVDFDPRGLVIANALPTHRLERLLLPAARWLESNCDTSRGRQLFAEQAPGCAASLDASANPVVRDAWAQLRTWRQGVTQERMRGVPRRNPEIQ